MPNHWIMHTKVATEFRCSARATQGLDQRWRFNRPSNRTSSLHHAVLCSVHYSMSNRTLPSKVNMLWVCIYENANTDLDSVGSGPFVRRSSDQKEIIKVFNKLTDIEERFRKFYLCLRVKLILTSTSLWVINKSVK